MIVISDMANGNRRQYVVKVDVEGSTWYVSDASRTSFPLTRVPKLVAHVPYDRAVALANAKHGTVELDTDTNGFWFLRLADELEVGTHKNRLRHILPEIDRTVRFSKTQIELWNKAVSIMRC